MSSKSSLTSTEVMSRYQRAQAIEGGMFNNGVAFNTTLYPHWIGQSDCFWYVRDLPERKKQYRLVDAEKVSNELAFDHSALARCLEPFSTQKIDPYKLPIMDVEISLPSRVVCFTAFGKRWQFADGKVSCQEDYRHPTEWKLSPDGKKAIFARDYNLWLHDLSSGEDSRLTTQGNAHYVYGGTATAYGRQEAITLEVCWSPDSSRILTVIKDNRDVKVGQPLVKYIPEDGCLRPEIIDPDRRVAFAGDEHIEGYRLVSIDVCSGQQVFADYPLCPVFSPPYIGFFSGERGWWAADSQSAYFIDLTRSNCTARLIKFDTFSGQSQIVIEEAGTSNLETEASARFNFIPRSHLHAMLVPLLHTKELVWYSERSGWAHLYLYDMETGDLKRTITRGEWTVRSVLYVDIVRRDLIIQTAGRVAKRNPYYCDICRVNIDTGELTALLSTDHEYLACDPKSRATQSNPQAVAVSPTGNYIVTTRSRVDEIPESLLLDKCGEAKLTLERGTLVPELQERWRWPEPVMLKAADGETDIYGVVFRPSNFSEDKSYPIIDCSFGTFLPPIGSFTNNKAGDSMYLSPIALAELGFITVMIAQRGMGEGMRSRAFTSGKEYWNCLSPNQVDCVVGIQQLAKRYPYMDLNRVGVGLFPSTDSAIAGMLRFPDFYKVGVSSNAYCDNRMVGEFNALAHCVDVPASGEEAGDHPFHALAADFQGKLLFIHGIINPSTPVSATLGFVEALHKANKDFDQLLLPNLGHETTGYIRRRLWNYFLEHLLGETPPKDFKLKTGSEVYVEEMSK